METLLLIIGVVGLAVSGWFLRGYLMDNPSAIYPPSLRAKPAVLGVSEPGVPADQSTSGGIPSEVILEIRQRLTTLEELGYAPKVEPVPVVNPAPFQPIQEADESVGGPVETTPAVNSQTAFSRLEEIKDLQRQYLEAKAKEELINFQWEEDSFNFDLNQSYNGEAPGLLSDEERENQAIDERLSDNLLEEGERVEDYRKRLEDFGLLTKEVLVTRLDEFNQQLREQQDQHLAEVLALITSLLRQSPSDGNWKRVAQSSFVAASTEISDVDGAPQRGVFIGMFHQEIK